VIEPGSKSCGKIAVVGRGTCRARARAHGWVFVIPLTAHTSYGYIFNRDVSSLEEVEKDFDELPDEDGVPEFAKRAVLRFPNFVHRRIYDGVVARIGNAGGFMQPLEATAIRLAEMQVGMILQMRLNRPAKYLQNDVPAVNRFLVNEMLGLINAPVIDQSDWERRCGFPFTSFAQMSQGLGA